MVEFETLYLGTSLGLQIETLLYIDTCVILYVKESQAPGTGSIAMYAALASVALGSTALWSTAAACQYSEDPDSVFYGNAAVRVPIASVGEPAQNECAATAQAYGHTIASIGELLASPVTDLPRQRCFGVTPQVV